jgi:hypothetical protein
MINISIENPQKPGTNEGNLKILRPGNKLWMDIALTIKVDKT